MNFKKLFNYIIEFIAPTCTNGGHRQQGDMVTNIKGNRFCWHSDCIKANLKDMCNKEYLAEQWQSVDDFQKEANEGRCWIVYKDMVMLSHYDKISFWHYKTSPGRYKTECISSVMVLNSPEKPSKL